MIELSPRLNYLMSQDVINAFICVEIDSLYLTSFSRDLIIDGNMYMTTDLIFKLDEAKLTSTIDRDLYKITLADSVLSMGEHFDRGLNGAKVTVRVGFVDNENGLPETADMFLVYKGVIEGYSYNADTSIVGELLVTITCSNMMATLDSIKPYYTSKNYVEKLRAGDTSYDQINIGSGAVVLRWGKTK